MNTANLRLIEQPAWKVRVVDFVARVVGLLAHVEGIPVGRPTDAYLARWRRGNESGLTGNIIGNSRSSVGTNVG